MDELGCVMTKFFTDMYAQAKVDSGMFSSEIHHHHGASLSTLQDLSVNCLSQIYASYAEVTQSTTIHIKFGLLSSVEAQTSAMHASTSVVFAPGRRHCTLTVALMPLPSHASRYQSS